MKGIVFNLLEQVVTREFDLDTWDSLLESAQAVGAYTSLGNYPDEELFRIVEAAAAKLKKDPQEVIRWFGVHMLGLLETRYPQLFEPHQSTRPFLLTLNSIIHPEVRKLYPGADVPEFDFDDSDPEVLVMNYQSGRRLCSLAEGLIEGAAGHYGETATIGQSQCMLRGDACCRFELKFESGQAT